MRPRYKAAIVAALVLSATLALGDGAASAHEEREAHGYVFDVGFLVEPAFEGIKNGVFISVSRPAGPDEGGHGGDGMMMLDVNEHGGIFGSPALAIDQTFSFQVTHELEGLTVPYHSHEDHDITGSITVAQDAGLSGTVDITIHDGMYMPADVTVQPGTTLVWTNRASTPQTATSGVAPQAGHAHESGPTVAVEGVHETLRVEVTHVPTGKSVELALRPIFGSAGEYTADLIPTAPGVYELRFFGAIHGEGINESFVSAGGGGGFDDVRSASELQFPKVVRSVREIEAGVAGAQNTARAAEAAAIEAGDDASLATTLALIGLALGAVGAAAGVGSLAITIRRG